MTIITVCKELDEFWQGSGAYQGLQTGDEDSREAVARFLDRNVVFPRIDTDNGEVADDGQVLTAGSGPEWASALIGDNPNWLRNRARNILNIADYLENRDEILRAKEAKADAALNRRRNELASEFTAVNSYGGQLPYTQNLINRIIELEGASK